MKVQNVEKELISVITEIQSASGLSCPPLNSKVVPTKEVPEFDSKVWIASTCILASKIEAEIPNDQNIFIDADTKQPMTISQIATFVCQIAKPKKSDEAA